MEPFFIAFVLTLPSILPSTLLLTTAFALKKKPIHSAFFSYASFVSAILALTGLALYGIQFVDWHIFILLPLITSAAGILVYLFEFYQYRKKARKDPSHTKPWPNRILVGSLVLNLIFMFAAGAGGGSSLRVSRQKERTPLSKFLDRTEILDAQKWGGKKYILVHASTTFPDFMQGIRLYRIEDDHVENGSEQLKDENIIFSSGLDDRYQSDGSGAGYTVRVVKQGKLNLEDRRIIVTFDDSGKQIIDVPTER